MKSICCYDGEWQSPEEVRIPIGDRSYFFGDAVYEAMIGAGGVAYRESDHCRRLFRNLRSIEMSYFDVEGLKKILRQAIGFTENEPFFLYLQISRDSKERCHVYEPNAKCHIFLRVDPFTPPNPEKRLSLITVKDRRYDFCHIKTTNLLPNVLAAERAHRLGADEAVFLRGENKTVTECSHSNILIVKDGVLLTHPSDCHILPGITRKRLLWLADSMKIPIKETFYDEKTLKSADSVIISATSKLAQMADVIDGEKIHDQSPIAERLCQAIFDDFREETAAPI